MCGFRPAAGGTGGAAGLGGGGGGGGGGSGGGSKSPEMWLGKFVRQWAMVCRSLHVPGPFTEPLDSATKTQAVQLLGSRTQMPQHSEYPAAGVEL